jgi:hypothetical protein
MRDRHEAGPRPAPVVVPRRFVQGLSALGIEARRNHAGADGRQYGQTGRQAARRNAPMKCSLCNGSRSTICVSCGGAGKVAGQYCWNCHGSGSETCARCNGSGLEPQPGERPRAAAPEHTQTFSVRQGTVYVSPANQGQAFCMLGVPAALFFCPHFSRGYRKSGLRTGPASPWSKTYRTSRGRWQSAMDSSFRRGSSTVPVGRFRRPGPDHLRDGTETPATREATHRQRILKSPA